MGTTPFGGGGVITFWGCFSFNSKLDLHVNDVAYDDNVLKNEYSYLVNVHDKVSPYTHSK